MCLLDGVDVPCPARRFLVLAKSRLGTMLTVANLTSDMVLDASVCVTRGLQLDASIPKKWLKQRFAVDLAVFYKFQIRPQRALNLLWFRRKLVCRFSVDSGPINCVDQAIAKCFQAGKHLR